MATWPIEDQASKVFPLYSRANVGEIFPNPISPLNASAGFQHSLEPGWRDAFVACGVWDHDLYDADVEMNILPAFSSYLYINMSLMRLFGVRVPGMSAEAVDLQYFGDMPGIPSYESERREFDENADYEAKSGAWLMNEVLGATDLAAYDQDRVTIDKIRADRPNMAELSDQELRERITSFDAILRPMFKHHIEASLKSGVGLGAMAQLAEAVGKPEVALTLLSGIGDVDSAAPSLGLWDLSRQARTTEVATAFDQGLDGLLGRLRGLAGEDGHSFVESLDQFLSAWDFRGPSEWEIRAVTWGVSPDMVLATIDRMRRVGDEEAPSTKNSARGKQREEAATFMREAFAGNDEVLGQFEAVLNAAALWLRGRERGRTTAAMAIHEIRLPALELGERGVKSGHLARREHIFMLFANELDEYLVDPGTFTETLADREKSYLALFDYVPPFVVSGEPPALTAWEKVGTGTHEKMRAGEILTGVSGCNGVARGRARVLLSPDDPGALEPGDILVAPITDPSWTPLFVAAAAVVVDVGAPFSHAAIVSRELGIPCVVSATAATKRIPDGALLEVDGGTGAITVIDDGLALV